MTPGQPEITLDPRRIRVLFGGHEIADSDQVLLVREAGEQPTLYFPRKDVEMTVLARTGLNALSPSKGVATHFTIYRDAAVVENAAWSFEDPPAPFALIAGHIVFHPVHFELAAHGGSPADWVLEPEAAAPPTAGPGFAADVAPMFRPEDIACMSPMGVHLDDPAWMTDPAGDLRRPDHANARRVFEQLRSGRMPPEQPWDDAQLATYSAWMAGGFSS